MIARRPVSGSCQKLTCSWPVPRSNTVTQVLPTASSVRVVVARAYVVRAGAFGGQDADVIGCAAHLRVYEPLGSLPEDERRQWAAYVESGKAPSRPLLMAREHEAAVTAALAVPPRVTFGGQEHAFVRHLDGLTYVCPSRLQLCGREALEDFCSRLPDEILEAFLPGAVCAAAEIDHDAWVAAHPDVRPGIRSETWAVPIPWFVLFEADERRLAVGDRRQAAGAGQAGLGPTGPDRARA